MVLFNQEQFDIFKSEILSKIENRNRFLRKGQFVYNEVYHFLDSKGLSDKIETLNNKDVDCFYIDGRIQLFLETLGNEIINKDFENGN